MLEIKHRHKETDGMRITILRLKAETSSEVRTIILLTYKILKKIFNRLIIQNLLPYQNKIMKNLQLIFLNQLRFSQKT